jgi:hypothetical protein
MMPNVNRMRVYTGRVIDTETSTVTVTDRRDLIYDDNGRLQSVRKVPGRKPRFKLNGGTK